MDISWTSVVTFPLFICPLYISKEMDLPQLGANGLALPPHLNRWWHTTSQSVHRHDSSRQDITVKARSRVPERLKKQIGRPTDQIHLIHPSICSLPIIVVFWNLGVFGGRLTGPFLNLKVVKNFRRLTSLSHVLIITFVGL